MKHGSVVPDAVSPLREGDLEDIGLYPLNLWSSFAETSARFSESGRRQIENRDVLVASVEQIID